MLYRLSYSAVEKHNYYLMSVDVFKQLILFLKFVFLSIQRTKRFVTIEPFFNERHLRNSLLKLSFSPQLAVLIEDLVKRISRVKFFWKDFFSATDQSRNEVPQRR